jgi:predicted membrane protein (TIGR00267 family)
MKIKAHILRNFIFGSEDALVSSVGALFGLAASNLYTQQQLITTGLVVISVEALSMGVGSFLTEESINEAESDHHKTPNTENNNKVETLVPISPEKEERWHTILGGIIMFLSYLLTGAVVLSPYMLIDVQIAKFISIGITLAILFFLGCVPSKNFKSGLRMLVVAGLAIFVGFLVASVMKTGLL